MKGSPPLNHPHGISLFEEIPENRSCKSAGISEHWCVCHEDNRVTNLSTIIPYANLMIKRINELLDPLLNICHKLDLDKVMAAYEHKVADDNEKYLLITMRAKPNAALFEATVKINVNTNKTQINGDISRINRYGTQSYCIDDSHLQKYCFCKKIMPINI